MIGSIVLASVALIGAVLLAARHYENSLAERALVAMLLWTGILFSSVHVLGWCNLLTPLLLGSTVVVLAGVCAAAALSGPHQRRADVLSRTRAVFALPWTIVRDAWHARSATFVALLVGYGIFGWSLFLAYLAPSGSWDGLWYHEPMVGFALQNHGFSWVEVPEHLEWVNGYPRLSENLMLVGSAFGDRRLIDAVPHPMAVTSMLGVVVLCRRFGVTRDHAILTALVLFTVPAVVLQLRSTYVDLGVLAAFVASVHFATKRSHRPADVWITGLAIGLLGASKANGIFFGCLLGMIALFAFRPSVRAYPKLLAHVGAAFALVLALAAPTFVRNVMHHDNPIWPQHIAIESLGIDLPGSVNQFSGQLPFDVMLGELFGVPVPGQDFADTRRHAYGYGLSYLGLPLVLFALGALVSDRMSADRRRFAAGGAGRLLGVFLLGLLTFLLSPSFAWGRFSLPFPALALVLIAAFLGTRPRGLQGSALLFAMFMINVLTLAWAHPRWDVPYDTAIELLDESPSERRYAETSPLLFSATARRWRDEHIGAGDVAAFDGITAFIGNGWDEGFHNRLIYVAFEGRDRYLDGLDEAGVDWVMVQRDRSEDRALASDERWSFQETVILDTMLYQRVARFGSARTEPVTPTVLELPALRGAVEDGREGEGEGEGEREGGGEGEDVSGATE